MNKRIFPLLIVPLLLGVILSPFIFSNIHKLCSSITTGNVKNPVPKPIYGFLHFKSTDPSFKDVTFAADFAAVYYTAKNFDHSDIYTGKYQPGGRSALYPPLMYYLFNKTLCDIPFAKAALLHLLIQIIILLIATFCILQYYRQGILFIPTAVTYFILLFLTPVGLSWFERGQFDIYPALSILFFFFAVFESKGYAFALSAVFASLKWTIAPFFFQAFTIYLLFNNEPRKLKFFLIFSAIFLLTLLPFLQYCPDYLITLYKSQHFKTENGGISLVRILPRLAIDAIPLISLLLYLIPLRCSQNKNAFSKTFLPYMTALAVIDIVLPSITWTYRAVGLLGFIPMMIVWFQRYKGEDLYKKASLFLFIFFMISAFNAFWIFYARNPGYNFFIAVYLAYYAAVTAVTITYLSTSRS